MKWITHQTGAVLGALAFQLPAAGIAAASAGAIFPDVIDQSFSRMAGDRKARQRVFNRIHRGSSHWFGWWLGLFLYVITFPLAADIQAICAGLAFGGISHVFMDMLTTQGVPLLPFTRKGRFSLRICSTGTWGEYVFLAAMLGCAIIFMGDGLLENLRQIINKAGLR